MQVSQALSICCVVLLAAVSTELRQHAYANPDSSTSAASSSLSAEGSSEEGSATVERVDDKRLVNAYRIAPQVISGGLPDEQAFRALTALHVKTVISVDGAVPDVELAKRFGMRYVHLPHGYDGVPSRRARELAKAIHELPGPIYIHCHHGKHRSPAAATTACVLLGLIKPTDAAAVLKTVGTSESYRGLYRSAQEARKLDDEELARAAAEFPERAQVPPLAEAMVSLERTFDHVRLLAEANWITPQDHPDLDLGHEALLLREHFTELLRTPAVGERSPEFTAALRQSETAAVELASIIESLLAANTAAMPQLVERASEEPDRQKSVPADAIRTQATKSFDQLSDRCKNCHRSHRD